MIAREPRSAALLLVLMFAFLLPSIADAQDPPAVDQMAMAELDPIRCWWRTSSGAVRVGEPFSVVLTCAVLEAEDVQVVPDQAGLDGSAIPMAPFEVVSAEHPADLRGGQRRFFQYDYTVQIINADVIGQDVPLPELVIHYRINSQLPGSASQEGRDLTYVLPAHAVRVVSMVPQSAADIRDAPDARFGRIDALRRRAGILEIVAVTLMGLGGLMTVLAIGPLVRLVRQPGRPEELMASNVAILGLVLRELQDTQRKREQAGWSASLVSRASAALRIVAAVAIGRPVSQRLVEIDAEPGEGRLILQRSGRRAKPAAVSSGVTSEDVARELNRLSPAAPAEARQLLEGLHAELAALTAAQYGRPNTLDQEAVDRALSSAIAAAQSLRSDRLSPGQYFRRWTGRSTQPEERT